MSAAAVDHPALGPSQGAPLGSALLTDRQRVAVVLQGAALLAHLEFGRRRLASGWGGAVVDDEGMLSGLVSVRGEPGEPPQSLLRDLAGRLFSSSETIAGRGPARRVMRQLLELWRHDLTPMTAEETVTQILDQTDFLWQAPFGRARAALAAVHQSGAGPTLWVAGPGSFRSALLARTSDYETLRDLLSSAEAESIWRGADRDPDAILAAGNWRAAAAAWRSRVGRSPGQRLRFARVLFGLGRFASCLTEIARLRSGDARVLRAQALRRLGRLRAARREVEKLEVSTLGNDLLLEVSDLAVALYGNLGLPDRASEWTERAAAMAEGETATARAELVAFAAAWDRGDATSMRRHLEAASPLGNRPGEAWRWHKARGQEAVSRGDGASAVSAFSAALRAGRRQRSPLEAGDLWNEMALGRALDADLAGAERALLHTLRLHREAEGPRKTTLALFNLAEIRLRRGRLLGVADIVAESMRENRQAGNWRGLVHDLELQVRLELVRGRPSAALARASDALTESSSRCGGWRSNQLRALAARALGWLERSEEASAELELAGAEGVADFEPEERPALLALAGRRDAALVAVAEGPAAAVWRRLLTGEETTDRDWERAGRLEAYRFARLVFDVEALEPGRAPTAVVRRAASNLRRVGAGRMAERLEAGARTGWLPVAAYLEAGDESPDAVCRLVQEVGAGELRLALCGGESEAEEVLVAGPGSGEVLRGSVRDRELVLTASWIDPLVRVVFQLAVQAFHQRGARSPAAPAGAGGIVGSSRVLVEAMERLALLAPEPVPILVRGETGTGKELAARRVHDLSPRSAGPFVPFNCAATSRDLLMSDLFGHVRGAFTGAARDRAGIFETARGGTVFLDEIGDLPLPVQGFLLRVLQEGEVRRVGESLPRATDVRVVAASHRDLEEMVRQETFRRDLFYRLRVATIVLPPLRDRGDDVLALAEHFLARLRPAGAPPLSRAARAALLGHDWPGNVRELKNVLSVAVALAAGGPIAPEHLDLKRTTSDQRLGYHEQVLNLRRRLVQEALSACDGSLAAAARRLGLTRQALSYLVRKLEIDG